MVAAFHLQVPCCILHVVLLTRHSMVMREHSALLSLGTALALPSTMFVDYACCMWGCLVHKNPQMVHNCKVASWAFEPLATATMSCITDNAAAGQQQQ
jgi:hypothetical protein